MFWFLHLQLMFPMSHVTTCMFTGNGLLLSLPPPSWLLLAFRPVSPDSTTLMDEDVWQHYRFVSADNACAWAKKITLWNKEHMIGLKLAITYDDEAHTQWAVCLESQQSHIHHEVYCISYLKDVLVLELWLLISWYWMNHLCPSRFFDKPQVESSCIKASSSMEDVLNRSGALCRKTSIHVVCPLLLIK